MYLLGDNICETIHLLMNPEQAFVFSLLSKPIYFNFDSK